MRRRARGAVLVLVASAAGLFGPGCAAVRVWEVRPEPLARGLREALGEDPYGDPGLSPAEASASQAQGPPAPPGHALVRAEAWYREARRAEVWSRGEAARRYLEAMALASEAWSEAGGTVGPNGAEARRLYNRSLERLLRTSAGFHKTSAGFHVFRLDEPWRARMARDGVRVQYRRDGGVWDPESFTELRFPGDFVVRGMDHYYGAEGLGVPLIAVRKPTEAQLAGRRGAARFFPFWEVYPATALLRVSRDASGTPEAVLELHDTLRTTRAEFRGRSVPLASDLTTPTAYQFFRGRLKEVEQVSLFEPQKVAAEVGLHMLHPYEPGKIPVVMVHGLWSSPLAWAKVVNELRGDPAFRDRYQFWLYMYPTGNPFLLSAADFRRSLVEARASVDPGGADPAFDQMVLVGHSMGGLVSKLMVTGSGGAVWNVMSPKPFADLKAGDRERALLTRTMFFEPLPFVRRVVFIATPHRGSALGDQFIGRLADRLINLPSPLHEVHTNILSLNGAGFFNPDFARSLPTSVDELKLDSPILLAMDALPVAPRVTAHSVVGKLTPGPLPTSSDGVVPYASSHIDWAASEFVAEGKGHSCQDAPATVEEVRRILYLHLDEAGLAAPRTPTVR